jgi:tetratricopeptide (TPR) repeat protein
MGKRKRRTGNGRAWKVLRAPPPRLRSALLENGTQTHVAALLAPTEVSGNLDVELHLLARRVRDWVEFGNEPGGRRKASAEIAKRRAEFLSAAPARIRPALQVLTRVSSPRPMTRAEVQAACLDVVEWAQDAAFPQLAVDYAELCAAVVSEDQIWFARKSSDEAALGTAAWGAFVAARTNRIAGDKWRAEVYYSRAIRFSDWAAEAASLHQNKSERKRARSIYVRAHLGFGRLEAGRTRYRAAAKHYKAAARVAFEEGEEWLSAQTYHDLLALALEEAMMASVTAKEYSDFSQAREYGKIALERYPKHNERFPAAVHDFVFVLVSENRFRDAMPLLELLMETPIPTYDQVIGWSTLARTAAALGNAARYADAEARVLELAPHYDLHAASAFVNLAFGARALGDWELAEQYVRRGIAAAATQGNRLAVQVGRALLCEVEARDPAPTAAPPLVGREAQALRELASVIAAQLASWRGSSWTKKESQFGVATLGPV